MPSSTSASPRRASPTSSTGLIGAGASKAVLTYLVPSLALLYGAIFLDEEITAVALAGLALVLAGVAPDRSVGRSRLASRAGAASLTR